MCEKYDVFIGDMCDSPRVLIGDQAVWRNGLTTAVLETLQLSTLKTGITGNMCSVVNWYFNPWAKNYMHTRPSGTHPNILIPSKERALVEFIIFHDYFNEGILIEALQSYIYEKGDDLDELYKVASDFKIKKSLVDYWLQEAREDTFTCNGG